MEETEGAVLPVRQARSQETLERLLATAEAVIEEMGIEGATVPAIAGRAGVAVGTVYKRFRDKDALLRAVYERFFTRALEQNLAALDPGCWEGVSTRAMLEALVSGMVQGYRRRRGLLRGLILFATAHPDQAFRARAQALRNRTLDHLAALLAAREGEWTHPVPERAIRLVTTAIGLVLQSLVLAEGESGGDAGIAGLALDDPQLSEELAALAIAYLGARA